LQSNLLFVLLSILLCYVGNVETRHVGWGLPKYVVLWHSKTRKTCLGMSPRHVRKTLLLGVPRRHVNVATYDMSSAMSL
jgi:hypothetical protein